MWTVDDHRYMARALTLARRGLYTTHPNPRVGCVLVRDGRIAGEGWHRRTGEPHAEVLALTDAGERARGSICYVTLEPCCHHGRTPPCTEALIGAGIARVVLALRDPNPAVRGGGVEALRAAGIQVLEGLGEPAAVALNRGFVKRMRLGLPWVTAKVAMSLDGRVALASGASRWISGESARRDVQRLRARSAAILTGIGTVLADDPLLTVRVPGLAGREPLRVILDTGLRMPPDAHMLRGGGRVLVIGGEAEPEKRVALAGVGAEVAAVALRDGRPDLTEVLRLLAGLEVNEVLVEAGSVLTGAFIVAGLVDELVVYLAPKLLGSDGIPMAAFGGYADLMDCPALEITDVRALGPDWRITSRPRPNPAAQIG